MSYLLSHILLPPTTPIPYLSIYLSDWTFIVSVAKTTKHKLSKSYIYLLVI